MSDARGTTFSHLTPAPTRPRRAIGSSSTVSSRSVLRRMTSSSDSIGLALWPVRCGATRRPFAAAYRTISGRRGRWPGRRPPPAADRRRGCMPLGPRPTTGGLGKRPSPPGLGQEARPYGLSTMLMLSVSFGFGGDLVVVTLRSGLVACRSAGRAGRAGERGCGLRGGALDAERGRGLRSGGLVRRLEAEQPSRGAPKARPRRWSHAGGNGSRTSSK